MRFILKTVLTLLTVAVLAIGAVAFLVPTDAIRNQAIALVEQHTGRQLEVRGETSFTFFPAIGVALEDVALSNPPSMGGGPMLRMESLTVDLKLVPLLSRSVEVNRFVLVRPIFDLRVDAQGNRNWDFAKPQAALGDGQGRARDVAGAAPERKKPRVMQAQAAGLGGGLVQDIRLGTVRIEDGTVVYANAINGASHRIDALNVSLKQEQLSAPMDAEGSMVWRGEKIEFKANAGTPAALLQGGSTAIDVSIVSAPAKAGFKGSVAAGGSFTVEGDLTANTPSVRGLADWAADPLPPGKGFGPASFSGKLKYDGSTIAFNETRFSLDGMNGRGNGSVSLKGAKPYIRAALALDKLDLNAWVGEAAPAPRGQQRAAPAPTPQAPRAQQAPPPAANPQPKQGQSLTDFINELNQQPRQPEVRAWSQRAINLAMLNTFDADINMNTGALYFDRLKVGASAVSASLKGGVMTANLNRIELYGGSGTGRVTVNAARKVPAMALNFDLKGMSAQPFLIDWMDFKRLSGRADFLVNVSGTGHTQQQIVASLQGSGSVQFRDGAIEGINIPAMVRGIKEGRFIGWRSSEREKTDFSSLTGTYTIRNGIVSNGDLNLIGPLVRMTGSGTVNLPRETLDYSLTPRLVASLQGQGGEQVDGGIVIPVRVEGPFADPRVRPDLKKIMEDPNFSKNAVETVNKAIKGLGGDKKISGEQVEQLLQGVLGRGQQGQQGGQQAGQPNAQDLLNQFLKKRQ